MKTTHSIRIKKGNDEIEVHGNMKDWVTKTFETLRKKYVPYYEEDKDKESKLLDG